MTPNDLAALLTTTEQEFERLKAECYRHEGALQMLKHILATEDDSIVSVEAQICPD